MKGIRIISLLMVFLLAFGGCGRLSHDSDTSADGDSNTKQGETLAIGWEFVEEDGENNPTTKVYLVMKGEEANREYIGEYIGSMSDEDPASSQWGYPDDALLGCMGWYAGAGDLLAVVREKPDRLVVQHKYIGESEGDPETEEALDEMTFEVVKSFEIDKHARIEVSKDSGDE